jgi:hypothetical protein
MEVAFGYRPDDATGAESDVDPLDAFLSSMIEEIGGKKKGLVVEGANFSVAVGGSPFPLEGLLKGQTIDADEPVVAFAHVTCPRLVYLDRGKTEARL